LKGSSNLMSGEAKLQSNHNEMCGYPDKLSEIFCRSISVLEREQEFYDTKYLNASVTLEIDRTGWACHFRLSMYKAEIP
jgi:hypothetical protein